MEFNTLMIMLIMANSQFSMLYRCADSFKAIQVAGNYASMLAGREIGQIDIQYCTYLSVLC